MVKIPGLRKRRANKSEAPEQTTNDDAEDSELRMSFFDHLNELRVRVTRAFIAVVIGTVIAFFVTGPVLDYLRTPYCEVTEAPTDCELVILGPTGGIVAFFRVALTIGAILAIPIITYQAMMFVLPGLHTNERRYVLLSIPPITLLFLIGAAFAWFVLMRPALGFLEGFQPVLFKPEWTADLYLSFVTSLVFWMGVAFETPLVFFVFSLLGIVRAEGLVRNWRIAIIASAVAAALITPTIDPVNMFLVMGPLLALYVMSIFLVLIGQRISGARNKQPT